MRIIIIITTHYDPFLYYACSRAGPVQMARLRIERFLQYLYDCSSKYISSCIDCVYIGVLEPEEIEMEIIKQISENGYHLFGGVYERF